MGESAFGNGEADSSILSGSATKSRENTSIHGELAGICLPARNAPAYPEKTLPTPTNPELWWEIGRKMPASGASVLVLFGPLAGGPGWAIVMVGPRSPLSGRGAVGVPLGLIPMPTIDFSDDERAAVTGAVRRTIDADHFPHAPGWRRSGRRWRSSTLGPGRS
jgi:hypothetical protein